MNIWKACLRRRNNVQYEANVTAHHLSFEKRYFIKYGRIDVICGLKNKLLGNGCWEKPPPFFLEIVWERDETSSF